MMLQQPCVLVIATDLSSQKRISQLLRRQHLHVLTAVAHDAVTLYTQVKPDLVVLNLDPRNDLDLYRRLRQYIAVPIIVLVSTDTTVSDIDLSADTWLTTAFEGEELLAYVDTVLRRMRETDSERPHDTTIFVEQLEIDLHDHRLLRAGQAVRLTRTEWALLEEFVRHTGQVLTHRMLLQRVWGDSYADESSYLLHVHIGNLRRKLGEQSTQPRYIFNEPGIGYRFVSPANIPLPITRPEAAATPATRARPPTNLPIQRSPLIGRDSDIAAIKQLLRREDVGLLTLTGPPGVGKTRMGLQVATELGNDFAHGVFIVVLAPINDWTLVPATIAQTLGLKEAGDHSIVEGLKTYLRDKQLLLLLDNFEHVVSTAPIIGELLKAAPELKVLVTSRVRLHVYGEHEFPIAPLALPDLVHLPALDVLVQIPAVRLFLTRVQAIKPGFDLTSRNAAAVAAICVRLDGLPLAIELAAAYSKLFSPSALLARLDYRLQFLTVGAQNLPIHHQTLRGAIDWSYQLLDAQEQRLSTRLGVFVGGCTLGATEAVCSASGDLTIATFGRLMSLVDKSVLLCEEDTDSEPRFTMLETIREYVLEQLELSGEADAIRSRHATYYLEMAETAELMLTGSQQSVWLNRLEKEHDNLRTALRWSLDRKESETAMRLGGTLWQFWRNHGHLSEGRKWLAEILERCDTTSTSIRAKVLRAAGLLALNQGDYAQANPLFEQSLLLYRGLENTREVGGILNDLGTAARGQGEYARSQAFFAESLTIQRELGYTRGIANALSNLGVSALRENDSLSAYQYLEEGLRLFQELGDERSIGITLLNLGLTVQQQGHYLQGNIFLRRSLEIRRRIGDRMGISLCFQCLGYSSLHQSNYTRAKILFQAGLKQYKGLGMKNRIAEILEYLAHVAVAQKRSVRAVQLYSAAKLLRDIIGAPLAHNERPIYERHLADTHAQLDEASWVAAWAEGQAMTLEEAITYALEQDR